MSQGFSNPRGQAIVTTTGIAGGHWREVTEHPNRDISLGGSMGQTASAALVWRSACRTRKLSCLTRKVRS